MTIYFDHAATTPVDREVLDEMLPFFCESFGNPSSIHAFGQKARRGLDLARERVADLISADFEEIVFTSGGTESDNHAIQGAFEAHKKRGNHVITTAIEHQAVLSACHALETKGTRVTYLGVDENGLVDPVAACDAMADDTALISVMAANNDVGVIQPVSEIAEAAHKRGIVVHSDAVQAVGKVPLEAAALGADLISFSSHKIHGPKGAGALYIRRGTRIAPLIHGGHHESRRRAGTENVPAIVGFGKACELASKRIKEDAEHIQAIRQRLEEGILSRIKEVQIHAHRVKRLPGTLNASFNTVEGEALLMALDLKGIAVSTGSACSSVSKDPSHVLTAMGCTPSVALNSIRFSLGRGNTEQEVYHAIEILVELVNRLRRV